MSIKVMSQVWERSTHTLGSLLVMLAIADHADDEGVAYPTIARLAEKTRMTERNVQLLLKKLSASGELVLRPGEGPHGCHLYQIAMHEACRCHHGGENISGEKFSGENISGVKNFQMKNPAKNAAPLLPPPSPVPSPLLSPPVPDPSGRENQDPPSPPAEGVSPAGKPRAPRAIKSHRCPADYQPGEDVRAWAASHWPRVDFDEALDAMRDHEFRTPRSDWDATLRNWIRREGQQARASPHAAFPSRAVQRDQFNVSTTLQMEEMLNGTPGHAGVRPGSRSAGSRLSRRIDAPPEAGVLDRAERPAP